MSTDELDVLLIEDNPGDARLIEEMLQDAGELLQRVDATESVAGGATVHREERLSAGLDRLSAGDIDVLLLDLGLPDSTGLDTLATVIDATTFLPVVVLTGLSTDQIGIEAIKNGAQDYLVKDEVESELLVRTIHHAIERNRQEREQTRRRQQLEALNTLTRDLMDAQTGTEVSEYVVEAAEEFLGLPVAAVALYDGETGVLEPTRATDAAAELLATSGLLERGDGAGWQSFVGNENRRISLAEDETTDGSVSELAIFPLTQHGVFVAGATESPGFSATNFEFAETVAGNLESALDRVDRERKLYEREQTLQEQTEALERLNRVNDIIRNIAQALVQASTRAEIESVVCEQLTDAGPYELAWIGEHDTVAEQLTPRASAGSGESYLDEISISTAEDAEAQGPARRAVLTREPQVVNSILENRAFESWRQQALNYGYHASISLPLIYDGTLYGILNIYSGQPGVFDELEQAVLTELADTIAYAINAVERKKALLSSQIRRLTFDVTNSNLGLVEVAKELGAEFFLESIVLRPDGGVRGFYSTRGFEAEEGLEFTHRLPASTVTLISETGEDEETVCLFEADLTSESLAATTLDHGGRLHTYEMADGTATVVVEMAADAAVREFVEMFQEHYPGSELVAQRTHQQPQRSPLELRGRMFDTLTDRQLETLQIAYFSGYFEEPRTRTASEIAGTMDIAQPTFNSHLRAAQQKIFHQLLDDDMS
ncbi:hypothetical protein HALDL1_11890 [Halobacterium sp. DL1]|jgi:predicted DNA binding protein/GAF domain-containing protein/CheY-like chemotaxis protein|nr:hypothetical protein HALDL1_11890 [Halobacterium sp. DL1]